MSWLSGETQEEDMAEVLPPLLGHVLCDLKTSLQLAAKSTKLESKSLNKKPCRAIPGLGEAPAVVRLSSGGKGGGFTSKITSRISYTVSKSKEHVQQQGQKCIKDRLCAF